MVSKIDYKYPTLPGYIVNFYNSKNNITNKDADEFDLAAAQNLSNTNNNNSNNVNIFQVPVLNQVAQTPQPTIQNTNIQYSDGTYGKSNTQNNSQINSPITKIVDKNIQQNINIKIQDSSKATINRIDIFNKNLSCLDPKNKNKNKCFYDLGIMAKQFWKSTSLANKYCYTINKKYRLVCANGALAGNTLTLPKK